MRSTTEPKGSRLLVPFGGRTQGNDIVVRFGLSTDKVRGRRLGHHRGASVRFSEWVLVVYLTYLVAILPLRRLSRARQVCVVAGALPLVALVVLISRLPLTPVVHHVRTWLPLPYLLLGYWLSGMFFVDPQASYEARFTSLDERLQRAFGLTGFATRAPRALIECLETAYFSCYVVIPAGLIAYVLAGHEADANRYWSIVLMAELGCYGVLPWIRTRPPWALLERSALDDRDVFMRRVNRFLIQYASTRANTFPSGHAAGALATALAVAGVWPAGGVVFFLLAISIAVGSVAGEYHYSGDAIAGVVTALAAWGLVAGFGL
ncbi:MAG TPA: phosphatase PAP2 family protein [Vicinamibacterales bacterium]|jgi:membrane-associated phospholipid phosphatase